MMSVKNSLKQLVPGMVMLLLSACIVGPNYVKPTVVAPAKYKETPKGWKVAHPRDVYDRGPWWHMFHDKELNKLEAQMNITNQNIEQSYEQFMQARALVAEARASFFPLVTGSLSVTRERQSSQGTSGTFVSSSSGSTSSSDSSSSGTSTTPSSGGASTGAFSSTSSNGPNPSNSHSLFVDATWEPDIWGSVHRQVEASVDNAQASMASLESVRLSSQATLAQDYFELRALDNDQKILDDTVNEYKKALKLTSNEYKSGTAAKTDYILAKTQLETAEASALNNHTARAQFEHAIAVLINLPPANFQILARPCDQRPPTMPVEVPSLLLERRPDVAQAERLAAQANAQIGVAISAYFPVHTGFQCLT
jgi:outer membrane protein TolC